MPDIRTTIKPGEVQTVSDTEFLDLDRMGLVLEVVSTPATEASTPKPAAPKPTPKVVRTSTTGSKTAGDDSDAGK